MGEKKDKFIGTRLTEQEKQELQELVDSMGMSLSDFFRDAIFSHANFLKKNRNKIERVELLIVKEV